MANKIVYLNEFTKGRIIESLSRALSEVTQAQRLIGPIRPTDGLTVNRQLAMVKYDLTSCVEQVLAGLRREVH